VNVISLLANEYLPDPRVKKIISCYRECGYQVDLLVWDRQYYGLPKAEVCQSGARVRRFMGLRFRYGSGMVQIIGLIMYYLWVCRQVVASKPDLIIAHEIDVLPMAVCIAIIKRARLVVDLHELYSGCGGFVRRQLSSVVERLLLKHADVLLYVNDHQAEHYSKFASKQSHSFVLPNYPETVHFKRSELPEHFAIGYFGTVRDKATLLALLMAGKQLGVKVMIRGRGSAETWLKSIAENYPGVIISGAFSYDDLPNFYKEVSCVYAVYVQDPSTANGIAVKALEGLAVGRPVILSDYCPLADEIRGAAGCVVIPGCEHALKDAIEDIQHNLEHYARHAGVLGQKFSWEEVTKEFRKRIIQSIAHD